MFSQLATLSTTFSEVLKGQVSKEEFLGHTRGRLGCKERGYIRRKKFYNEGTFLRERERERSE